MLSHVHKLDLASQEQDEADYLERFLKSAPDSYRTWLVKARYYRNTGLINPNIVLYTGLAVHLRREADRKPIFSFFKGFVDRVLGLFFVAVFSPVLISAALAIKLTSRGPVFFRQLRGGRFGSPFWIYKFRTMYEGADRMRAGVQPLHKRKSDPRSTVVGKFLRKWKIDEMPQLLNVLLGEMSIVGPRPLSLDEGASTPDRHLIRFAVKPGLTGLWQATRSNLISGSRKIALDALYVRNRGVLLDLKLLVLTLKVVLRGEEAK